MSARSVRNTPSSSQSGIHLLTLSIGRMGVACVYLAITLLRLVHLLDATRVLLGNLSACRSVADGWQLRSTARWIVGSLRSVRVAASRSRLTAPIGSARTFVIGFTLVVLVLLALLPLLADLFEFYGN